MAALVLVGVVSVFIVRPLQTESGTRAALADPTGIPAAEESNPDGGAASTSAPPGETPPPSSPAVEVRPDGEAIPPLPGVLDVRSRPAGAQVLVNGVPQGGTPLSLSLAPGSYRVQLEHEGFLTFVRRADLSAGQTLDVVAELQPAPPAAAPAAVEGRLIVSVRPSGDVYIDGVRRFSEISSAQTLMLPTGSYRVTAEHPTLGHLEEHVTIVGGQEAMFDADLTPVNVMVLAFDAAGRGFEGQIYLDGQATGRWTPGNVSAVPLGQHQFEVRNAGHRIGPRSVTISRGTHVVELRE
jgi:hypothetical protein